MFDLWILSLNIGISDLREMAKTNGIKPSFKEIVQAYFYWFRFLISLTCGKIEVISECEYLDRRRDFIPLLPYGVRDYLEEIQVESQTFYEDEISVVAVSSSELNVVVVLH